MKISAVIGASFGDEGKGAITDYLTSKSKSLVIRYNGGAQAGHTVTTPKCKRHVFKHFGSGTFNGAPTFLSRFFICNPMLFITEWQELWQKLSESDFEPNATIDPACLVTTPWDMMINQALEMSRGDEKHGSCGVGIHETVLRNQDPDYALTYQELCCRKSALANTLEHIQKEYVRKREEELKIKVSNYVPQVNDRRVFDKYWEDINGMTSYSKSCSWSDLELDGYDLVFEGAQGLRLDMDMGTKPHVTHSNTGLKNVGTLLEERNIKETLNAYYVTRTYLTRHGAGPLENELVGLKVYSESGDDTNQFNSNQGWLRQAYIDSDQLVHDILEDISLSGCEKFVKPRIALTCADQVDNGKMKFMCSVGNGFSMHDALCELPTEKFAEMISGHLDAEGYLISYGKTRKCVREGKYGCG